VPEHKKKAQGFSLSRKKKSKKRAELKLSLLFFSVGPSHLKARP
jgi:hypothetical protein